MSDQGSDSGAPRGKVPARPERFVSLLGETTDAPPQRPIAGPLPPQGSEHSRFDQLQPPTDDFDLVRARAVCGEISRHLLQDLAPALLLLPNAERLRVRALLAWTRTLLDFANDPGLEGERLAQINRWQYALEQSFDGQPPGQPIFVVMAALERERPWPREAFDELASIARMRISADSTPGAATGEEELVRLFRAGAQALFGVLDPSLEEIALALAQTHSLLALREPTASTEPSGQHLIEVSQGIRRTVASHPELGELPSRFRPAARFLLAAALEVAKRVEAGPLEEQPPRLGPWTRARLLVSARLGARVRTGE